MKYVGLMIVVLMLNACGRDEFYSTPVVAGIPGQTGPVGSTGPQGPQGDPSPSESDDSEGPGNSDEHNDQPGNSDHSEDHGNSEHSPKDKKACSKGKAGEHNPHCKE